MDRRAFLGTIAGGLVTPRLAQAQQGRVPHVGFVEAGAIEVNRHYLDAFRQGLRDLGYVEGQSVVVEDRWADGRSERFPQLLDELVQRHVDVIVQASSPGAVAAKRVAPAVPIVFWGVSDPVALGLVASLARPGGNMTGLVLAFGEGFVGKWLEILKDAVPTVSRLGVLWNPEAPGIGARVSELGTAASRLGLVVRLFPARSADELGTAFAAMRKAAVGGLIVLTDPLTLRHRLQIVHSAADVRLPAVYGFEEFARVGGLMAYGPSVVDEARRAATYVDKILKGAKPAELPIEQPTKFELVVNLKAAKAIGLTIPPGLLQRADQVIE